MRGQTIRRSIRFPFDLDAYANILPDLASACAGADELELDFSQTERAYPDGMVPLVATLMSLKTYQDVVVSSVSRRQERLARVFDAVGWRTYMIAPSPQYEDLPRKTPQFTPLRPFGRSELGPLHKSIMEVFVRQTSLAPFVADAAHWALWEVMDNVLNHAEVPNGWVQAATFAKHKHINIVVADSGIGVGASLRERYPGITERDAIRRAVEKGETRDPSRYQGNGLHGSRDIAIQSGGQLVVVSDDWKFVQEGVRPGEKRPPLRRLLSAPGTASRNGRRTDASDRSANRSAASPWTTSVCIPSRTRPLSRRGIRVQRRTGSRRCWH